VTPKFGNRRHSMSSLNLFSGVIMQKSLLLVLTFFILSGCGLAESYKQQVRNRETEQWNQQEAEKEGQRLISTIPEEEQLDCKMRAEAVLATERVYNVGLPTLWDGQQTTYGQGARRVYYTCLDMKLAQMNRIKQTPSVVEKPRPTIKK
jgi:hypothetical protein